MIPLSPRHRRNARTAGKRFRPQVCALEDRCLLSTLVTDFLLPAPATAIVRGPDGNVWFTEPAAQKIAQITPAGTITQFDLPAGSHASGLAVGTDGNLWITDNALKQIDRITPAGIVTQFPVATTTSGSFLPSLSSMVIALAMERFSGSR